MKTQDKQHDSNLKVEFEQVFSTHFQRMFLYARKLLKSDHLAEDVVEEVFYNLWKTKSDFSEIREIETYLFVSVKNQVIRMLSKDPGVFVSFDIKNELKQVEQISPEDILLEKELLDVINVEISNLPEQCQIIFKMSRNKYMEHHEIATEMGISIDAVKSQICKAVSKIRACVSNWSNSDEKLDTAIKEIAR